jgi:hypothetical protein
MSRDELLNERNQIRPECVEDLLVEVSSGKHVWPSRTPPYDLYASRTPSPVEQEQARIIYVREQHKARLAGLKTRAELEILAVRSGQFDPAERSRKVLCEGMLKKYLQARERSGDARQKVELDAQIQQVRTEIFTIDTREERVLRHSVEAYADEVRNQYLIACCTLEGELLDTPVWPSWDAFQSSTNVTFLGDARRGYFRVTNGLSTRVIRALARSGDWRVRWKGCQETGTHPFDGSAATWDRNKLALVYWSDFYDSVYEHPECPADDIIGDDDHLQEWLNQQVAKRKAESAKRNKGGGGTGVFYRDGSGQRKQMTNLGSTTKSVSTPFKIRT